MVGMDTMAIGGSDIAKDLLRVKKNFDLYFFESKKFVIYF